MPINTPFARSLLQEHQAQGKLHPLTNKHSQLMEYLDDKKPFVTSSTNNATLIPNVDLQKLLEHRHAHILPSQKDLNTKSKEDIVRQTYNLSQAVRIPVFDPRSLELTNRHVDFDLHRMNKSAAVGALYKPTLPSYSAALRN